MKRLVAVCLVVCIQAVAVRAADHGDMPVLAGFGRSDAQLTDLFVFSQGDDLVLALCSDPAVPPGVSDYVFASDLELTFSIDSHSKIEYGEPGDLLLYGGTIATPRGITADKSITITFDDDGAPSVKATGISRKDRDRMQVFKGLRDDPFIRRPRAGRNVAAVVVQLPKSAIVGNDGTVLVWATSTVPTVAGPMGDHAGRALRSMFVGDMNVLRPKDHFSELGLVPDVVIYNSSLPAGYPNGRVLTDDVIDLVLDIPGGTLPGEGPSFPTMNDVPFLAEFPYLAPPH